MGRYIMLNICRHEFVNYFQKGLFKLTNNDVEHSSSTYVYNLRQYCFGWRVDYTTNVCAPSGV